MHRHTYLQPHQKVHPLLEIARIEPSVEYSAEISRSREALDLDTFLLSNLPIRDIRDPIPIQRPLYGLISIPNLSHSRYPKWQSALRCAKAPPILAGPDIDGFPRTNLVIILGMMQVSKRIPFDDPQTLMLVRAGYVLSNIIIIALYTYVNYVINKKKGTSSPSAWVLLISTDPERQT
jgi:hypothetical protein